MSRQITAEVRAKAEVYSGDSVCQEKTKLLLKEVGLPNGLLPLRDILECGYVEETGFVWLKQKKKVEHTFASIGRLVSYAPEITAIVEKGRIKKVSGVKAKELLLWVPLYEISVDDPPTGKLTCKSTAGVTKTFPTSAFEVPDPEEDLKKKDEAAAAKDDQEKAKDGNVVVADSKVAPAPAAEEVVVTAPAPTSTEPVAVAQVAVNNK